MRPSADTGTAADHLSQADFVRLASLIHDMVGIKLPDGKRLMVESRLRRRVRGCGRETFRDYCAYLFDESGLDDELVHVIDALTTNKTDFFREPEHLTKLASHMVPELLRARPQTGSLPRLKLWSAASSNGSEAYSIAMVLADLATRSLKPFEFAILGTDISTAMLAKARRAIYPLADLAPVPAAMRDRYVMRGVSASHSAQARIVPELRQRVRFDRMNLMDASYDVDRDVDVIFLRNVLIYFTHDDQRRVVSHMISHLRRGGFLVVGHSESMVVDTDAVRQLGPGVFQKVQADHA